MGRTLKTFTVSWTPQGDPKRILGWNVVLNGSATDPYASPVYGQVFVPAPRGTDYSWVGSPRNVELKHVAVDGGSTVYAWVQQVYRGGDSEWISSTGASAPDDGIATADEIAETAMRKWAGESGADKTQSALDTGVTTTGTLQVKGGDNAIRAGITGAGSGDSSVRLWAGADFNGRNTAPFRVTQGGDAYMVQGYVGPQAVPVATVADLTERTTADITYTVASSGGDFTSVQAAIDALPMNLDHQVVIQIDTTKHSTWTESVTLRGFRGPGPIYIRTSSQNPANLVWYGSSGNTQITVEYCATQVFITNITFQATAASQQCVVLRYNAANMAVNGNVFQKSSSVSLTTGVYAIGGISTAFNNSNGTTPVDTGIKAVYGVVFYNTGFGTTTVSQSRGIVTQGFTD